MNQKIIIIIGILCLWRINATAQISSTFDADADNWTFFNGATGSSTPGTFNNSGGNPGGFVSMTYSSNTSITVQSWIAPSKFLGNQVARSFGMNFLFSLQQSTTGTNSNTNGDVRIESGGQVLVFSLLSKPSVAPAWSAYTLRLDETQGWRMGSTAGALATRSQIIQVLTNITAIEIRGTYVTNATYTSGLDNVVLEQRTLTPPPSISSFSPTQAQPGTTINISGAGFDPVVANNAVFFNNVPATIVSATAASLAVTVPNGTSFGPIRVINKTSGKSTRSRNNFTPTFAGGGRLIPSSFKTRFTIDHAGGMGGMLLSDLDSDGWTDIVVANQDNSGIRIYRNLGSGGTLSATSFANPVFVPTTLSGTNGAGLTVRDFDNDGKLDLATSGWTGGPGAFATFRNTSTPGNLTFESVEIWNGATDESPVTSAEDIDGDGLIDLVGGEGSSPGATWIVQNISTPGNIEFGYRQTFFGTNSHQGTTLADLDGDGKPEFILKIQNAQNQQNIYVNTSVAGNFSFGSAITLPVAIQGSMVVYDFNQDGKNDLAWKNGFSNDDVYVRLNTNSGGPLALTDFSTEVILDSETGYYGSLSMADMNGDGKPDLLVTDSDKPAVFENNYSPGTFDASDFIKGHLLPGVGATTYPTGALAADLNGDGKPDLVFGTTNTSPAKIVIYENQNIAAPVISINTISPLQAPVGATVTITGNNFSSVALDNFVYFGGVRANVLFASPTLLTAQVPAGADHDFVTVRVRDLSSTYHLPFHTTFSTGVNFNNTHFAAPVEFALANADYDIEIADLDNDGKPDVAAQVSGTNRTTFFANNHLTGAISNTSLTLAGSTASTATNPKIFDIDGNGLHDVVGAGGTMYQNTSSVGLISFGTQLTLGIGAGNLAYGDFNRDGKMDLVATNGGSAQLLLLENRSTPGPLAAAGTFGSLSNDFSIPKPAAGGDVVTADFDADGLADVITTNPTTDNLTIFPSANAMRVNAATFGTRIDISTGDNPGRIYTGDFDDDNKLDFFIYYSTGTSNTVLSVFHNQSTPGNFSFNRIDLTNPSATTVAHIADLDGDGKPEIITTSETGNRFSIFKNIHSGGALSASSFATPFNTTVTAPRGITTGDLNLDGKPEIILTRAAGFLVVYQNLIANPTITSFLPTSGTVGAQVVITGTNFRTTPAENEVKFNGTTAYVISSTATSITAIVPPGATTGSISVTVTNNTAISATNFTVNPFSCPPGSPTGGSLDAAFDPQVQSPVSFTAVELQSSGKSLVSAPDVTISGVLHRGLLRFNVDGTLDGTFAINNFSSDAKQLIVQPDDKIILFDNDEFASIQRLTVDGTNDPTFAVTIFDNSGSYATVVGPLELQSDGKVLYSRYNTFDFVDELIRLNIDGSVDASFNAPNELDAFVVRQQSDGKILVAGGFGIKRLDASGNVDASFASGPLDGVVNDLVIQPDNKIIIIGTFTSVLGVPTRNIARLLPNGSVDITFNSGNGFSQYIGSQPSVLKLLPSGQILVGGEFTSYNDATRNRLLLLNSNGSLDCTFDPLAGPNNQLSDIAVQADNKILIVGDLSTYDGVGRNAFARVNGITSSCVPASERAALVAFYNSTNGASWTNKTNWLSTDESTWFGVTVQGCRVTAINLDNNNVVGSMPMEIGNLPQLIRFNLGQQNLPENSNQINGPLPASFGNLSNLEELLLSDIELTGAIPTSISSLSKLKHLDLTENQLTGTLSSFPFGLTDLETLSLSSNQLTGNIPSQIGNLTKLKTLALGANQLNGNLPSELGNLSALTSLILDDNQFTGSLPASIGNLTNLFQFGVSVNQLSGSLPATMSNLTNLKILVLSLNQFTGDFPSAMGGFPNLLIVNVRGNQFTSIPTFLSTNITLLRVFDNRLNFGHLEPNIGKTGFVYSPQDNLPGGVASACAGSTLTINFSTPGTANQYQWFKDAVLIPGANSATFTKSNAVAGDAGNYSVRVTNTIVTGLTLTSDPFVVTITPLLSPPGATAAVNVCPGSAATLIASGATSGQYRWYTVPTGGTAITGQTNSTFVTPAVSAVTTFYVSVNNGTCESARTAVVVTPISTACAPPAIATATISIPIGDNKSLDLKTLITTTGGTLDVNSIAVTVPPPSGAKVTIVNGVLTLDYGGIAFAGKESLTVRACDTNGNCSTQQIEIEVLGDIVVYNALSPNGANPLFVIQFIDAIPETKNNIVTIFDRWQNEVWRGENYNNTTVVFKGISDGGNDLPTGTYFYKIQFASGRKTKTGFISLKR